MKLRTPKSDLEELKSYEKQAHFFGSLNYDDFDCKGMGAVYDEANMAVKSARGMIHLIYYALGNVINNKITLYLVSNDSNTINNVIHYLKDSKHTLFCANIYYFGSLHLDISKIRPVAKGRFNKYLSILESVVSSYQNMYNNFQIDTIRDINSYMSILKDDNFINPIYKRRIITFLQGTPKPYYDLVELLRYYHYVNDKHNFNKIFAKLPSLPDPEF